MNRKVSSPVMPSKDASTLSGRHKQVAGLVALGYSNRDIATELNLREQVVKNVIHSLFDELGVWNRVELANRIHIPPYPNQLLRKKLVVAGIPESEHSLESLAAKMPTDFRAKSFQGMSADMMAELLLYLIAKGIVTFPVAVDKALLNMPWGSHICQFYNRKEDLVKMLVPYFKQGLERKDACVWMVSDLTVEEAGSALAAAVPGLERYSSKGQMQIRHYTEFYTNRNGTVKPADTLRDQFAEMGSTVRAKGFRGLRASGSVSWINNEENMSRFMDYETKVHCAIQGSRLMAVCTYPARAAALHASRELIHNHGQLFVKRGESVHDNSRDAQKIEDVFASMATLKCWDAAK